MNNIQYLNSFILNNKYKIFVVLLLVIRSFFNAVLPLMDKTEARYGEISRLMLETNNWISPHIDYGVPFWAKPPLSIWLSSLSMKLFYVNEFFVRFPSLLVGIVLIFMLGKYAKRKKLPFFLPGFILLSLPEFFLHIGVVSTDMVLAFSIALIMLSYWEVINNEKRIYFIFLFSIGIILGLLTKGPIVLLLTLPPIFIWMLIHKKIKEISFYIFLFLTILGSIIISSIWYILAEYNTPGFIDYFIIGEHFRRYFDSSWTGDLYGFPKYQPFGIIWGFLFVFTLPWIFVLVINLIKSDIQFLLKKWSSFLLIWLLWTPFFFTFSKSLIHPYILPVMVPIALLILEFWSKIKFKKVYIFISLVFPIILLTTYFVLNFQNSFKEIIKSDKYIIQKNFDNDYNLFFLSNKSYSSQFYSNGKVKSLEFEQLEKEIIKSSNFYILIKNRDTTKLKTLRKNLKLIDSNNTTSIFINNKVKKP